MEKELNARTRPKNLSYGCYLCDKKYTGTSSLKNHVYNSAKKEGKGGAYFGAVYDFKKVIIQHVKDDDSKEEKDQ